MKKNNKGFMLVEVIIVTVVVATIMTSLYVVFNRVYNAYDKKSMYSEIDPIYALKMIEDYMLDEEVNNNFMLNNLINSNKTYTEITCSIGSTDFNSYCNAVFEEYNVNKIYLVENTLTALNSLKSKVTNQTFKDYIDYLLNMGINTTNFLGSGNVYTELFVIEVYTVADDKNNLNKYAYLPVRISELNVS